jgi:hypothetical protein
LLFLIIRITLRWSNNSLEVVDNKEECSIMQSIKNSSKLKRLAHNGKTWRALTFAVAALLGAVQASENAWAQNYTVANQATCNQVKLLGGTTATWSGSTCTIPAGKTLNLSDSLTIAPQATLKVEGTINVAGAITNHGKIILPLDPKGRITVTSGGNLVNKFGAKILSNGVIAVNSGATLTNAGYLHNMFASTFTVNGTLKSDNSVLSLSVSNNYNFTGTLEVTGTAYNDITLNGVVLVRIAATKNANNTYQLTVCDYDKNIDGTPDVTSTKIGPGERSTVCTTKTPAILASAAPVVMLIQNINVVTTNTTTSSTTVISSSTTQNKNSRSESLYSVDRHLGGTG